MRPAPLILLNDDSDLQAVHLDRQTLPLAWQYVTCFLSPTGSACSEATATSNTLPGLQCRNHGVHGRSVPNKWERSLLMSVSRQRIKPFNVEAWTEKAFGTVRGVIVRRTPSAAGGCYPETHPRSARLADATSRQHEQLFIIRCHAVKLLLSRDTLASLKGLKASFCFSIYACVTKLIVHYCM